MKCGHLTNQDTFGYPKGVRNREVPLHVQFFFMHMCALSLSGKTIFLPAQRVKGTVVACSDILNKAGLTGWKMGRSRVFLRYYHEEKLQLMLKAIDDKAILIQKIYRGHLARKWYVN